MQINVDKPLFCIHSNQNRCLQSEGRLHTVLYKIHVGSKQTCKRRHGAHRCTTAAIIFVFVVAILIVFNGMCLSLSVFSMFGSMHKYIFECLCLLKDAKQKKKYTKKVYMCESYTCNLNYEYCMWLLIRSIRSNESKNNNQQLVKRTATDELDMDANIEFSLCVSMCAWFGDFFLLKHLLVQNNNAEMVWSEVQAKRMQVREFNRYTFPLHCKFPYIVAKSVYNAIFKALN